MAKTEKASDVIVPDITVETGIDQASDVILDTPLDILSEKGWTFEKAVTNINERYKILDDKEATKDMDMYELAELHKAKKRDIIDMKMKYLETKVGASVENRPEIGLWMQALLQRFDHPETRKKAFMHFFPEGNYQQIPLINEDGKKKLIEIYKRPQDDNWGLVYPYGRDVGEFGVVGSEIFSGQTIGTTIGAITKSPALGAMIGDYLGVKTDKIINWAAGLAMGVEGGLGEDEFYQVESWRDIKPSHLLPGVGPGRGDVLTSLFVGGLTKGIGMATNLITGQSHPSLIPIAEEVMGSAYQLGVPEVMMAQVAVNPLIRSVFFQAGEMTGFAGKKITKQQTGLFNKFKAFGVSVKAADEVAAAEKEINALYNKGKFGKPGTPQAVAKKQQALNKALDEINVNKSISYEDWSYLVSQKTEELANAMKPFRDRNGNFVKPYEGYEGLKQAYKDWNDLVTVSNNNLRKAAINKSSGVSYTLGGKDGLKQLIFDIETGSGAFKGKGTSNVFGTKTTTITNLDGATEDIIQGISLRKFSKLKNLFDDIKAIDDVIYNKPGPKPEVGSWKAFDSLDAMRGKAFKLLNHKDKKVREAAEAVHSKIISIMDDGTGKFLNGGGPKYRKAVGAYLQDTAHFEKVTGLKNMIQAIDDNITPEQFASKFIKPGSVYDLKLLSDQLGGMKNVNFNTYVKSFQANLLRNPTKIREVIEDWKHLDPDGLKVLLDEKQIDDLLALGSTAETMNNSLVKEAFLNQSTNTMANTAEIVKEVIKIANSKNIGSAKAIQQFIKDSGGMDGTIMQNMRAGIIEDILNQSSKLDDIMNSKIIDPKKLSKILNDLEQDTHLKMLFTDNNLKTLKNFQLYSNIIGASSDMGGKFAAGQLRGELARSLLTPSKLPGTLKTLLSYDLTARILGRDLTQSQLNRMLTVDLANSPNYAVIRAMLAEISTGILRDGYKKQDTISQGVEPASDIVSELDYLKEHPMSETSAFKQATDRMKMSQGIEDATRAQDVSRANIPDGSRLAAGFNPVGIIPAATGGMDPNVMARGQQLFNKPGEITFANQGGIMSTNKAFQRVA